MELNVRHDYSSSPEAMAVIGKARNVVDDANRQMERYSKIFDLSLSERKKHGFFTVDEIQKYSIPTEKVIGVKGKEIEYDFPNAKYVEGDLRVRIWREKDPLLFRNLEILKGSLDVDVYDTNKKRFDILPSIRFVSGDFLLNHECFYLTKEQCFNGCVCIPSLELVGGSLDLVSHNEKFQELRYIEQSDNDVYFSNLKVVLNDICCSKHIHNGRYDFDYLDIKAGSGSEMLYVGGDCKKGFEPRIIEGNTDVYHNGLLYCNGEKVDNRLLGSENLVVNEFGSGSGKDLVRFYRIEDEHSEVPEGFSLKCTSAGMSYLSTPAGFNLALDNSIVLVGNEKGSFDILSSGKFFEKYDIDESGKYAFRHEASVDVVISDDKSYEDVIVENIEHPSVDFVVTIREYPLKKTANSTYEFIDETAGDSLIRIDSSNYFPEGSRVNVGLEGFVDYEHAFCCNAVEQLASQLPDEYLNGEPFGICLIYDDSITNRFKLAHPELCQSPLSVTNSLEGLGEQLFHAIQESGLNLNSVVMNLNSSSFLEGFAHAAVASKVPVSIHSVSPTMTFGAYPIRHVKGYSPAFTRQGFARNDVQKKQEQVSSKKKGVNW